MHSSYKYCRTLHDIDGWAAREKENIRFSRALGYNSNILCKVEYNWYDCAARRIKKHLYHKIITVMLQCYAIFHGNRNTRIWYEYNVLSSSHKLFQHRNGHWLHFCGKVPYKWNEQIFVCVKSAVICMTIHIVNK